MSGIEQAVGAERLRTVYRQLPLTLGVSLLNALLTAMVLAPRTGALRSEVWLAAFALMLAARFIGWRGFSRLPPDAAPAPHWGTFAVAGAAVSGALWGACSLWLMPPEQPYPLFVAFVVGGMCAGTVTVNAAHLASVVAFILPAVLPLAAWFALHGGRLSLAMALMTTLFAIALTLAASRFAAQFADSLRARLALAERTAELAAANAHLHAEIAERQEAEAALRQAQKLEAIGSLTAGVAHDFNNVLMVVRGAADGLRRLVDAPGPLRHIAAILSATERGAALTRQLLTFARKETLSPETVDLNSVLRGTASLLGAALGKSVRIELALAGALPAVFVDRGEMASAVINLAINARDAMPKGGTLTLRTRSAVVEEGAAAADLPPGRYAVVEVADTGTGMTEDVLARARDPFFTTKPRGQGSGLGLSQVNGLLRQSGGAMRIASTAGAGTTVALYLPPATAEARPPGTAPEALARRPAPQPPEAAELPHIALLDDEELVRDVVADMLRNAGYRVSAFARAADALRCVGADASVGLLVTDLGLPDGGGDEVARRARQMRPALPVLFITGHNDAAPLACEPWKLRKPFGEADLLATVARVLQQPSAAA